MDTHVPINTKIKTLCPAAPWYTPEIHKQKIIKRRLERRWRTTRLTVDREQYTLHCAIVNRLISNAKTKYYKDMISDCGSDQRELFRKTERIFKGNKLTAERNYPSCATSEQLILQTFLKIKYRPSEIFCQQNALPKRVLTLQRRLPYRKRSSLNLLGQSVLKILLYSPEKWLKNHVSLIQFLRRSLWNALWIYYQ